MKSLIILFALFTSLNIYAQQDSIAVVTKIERLYESKDYKAAYQLARQEANKGNAYAQYIVGRTYFDGKVVKQNYPEAVRWFKKAASNNEFHVI